MSDDLEHALDEVKAWLDAPLAKFVHLAVPARSIGILCDALSQPQSPLERMRVVPLEPTEAMLLAAFKQANDSLLDTEGNMECKTDEERSAKAIRPLWRAMVNAAPQGTGRDPGAGNRASRRPPAHHEGDAQ